MTRRETFIRATGEGIDGDPVQVRGDSGMLGCDICDHLNCVCDDGEPRCETCQGVLTFNGFCFSCDSLSDVTVTHLADGWKRAAA